MIHHRQCLAFLLEPGENRSGVHPRLDELECNSALDRFGLLGDPYFAHAAFADFFDKGIAAGDDGAFVQLLAGVGDCADLIRCRRRFVSRLDRSHDGVVEKAAGLVVGPQQRFHALP